MSFVFKGNLSPNGGRILKEHTLEDSVTFTEGDAMRLTSGTLSLAAAGNPVYGILVGFKTSDGQPVTTDGSGNDYDDSYTTGASNTVVGIVDVSPDSLYSVSADDTLGSTTGSNLAGYNMDVVAASDQLDESTAVTTTAQFFSFGQDPDGTAPDNSVIVKIQESQIKL